MGHIILGGTTTTVQKGAAFDVYVRVMGASPGNTSLSLEQIVPRGGVVSRTDILVLPDGSGSNYFTGVTLETTGYVTLRAADAAGQLLSDTLTVLVNP